MTEEILLRLTESKTYRAFALLLLPAAFIYGLVLPFCWGNNPAEVHGTLSLLCENHIPAFWVWTLLSCLLAHIVLYKTLQKPSITYADTELCLLELLADLGTPVLLWHLINKEGVLRKH